MTARAPCCSTCTKADSLRRNRRRVAGETYEYWTLVRTAKGPRQEVVASLGKEPGLESRVRHGWEQIGDLLEGRAPGVDWAQINDARLYRGLDVLHAHKDALCRHLQERYRSLFAVEFEFLLYDVTSTYFEGEAKRNEKAARGYSRDQRPDCKQVNLGLVVTPEGLPVGYEIFAGNTADVTTVEEMIELMEKKYGQAQRVWVMDRGMVSEENIEFLRARGARYLVGTPKSQLKRFEARLLEEADWTEVQPGVEAKIVAHPDGAEDEQYLLCRSQARAQKERAMLERQRQRLREKLAEIDASLRRRPAKDLGPIERRLGRWLGRSPAGERLVEVKIRQDEAGRACGLEIQERPERADWARHAHGAYLLRTNCTERDPAQLWHWYIRLTQAEEAFRISKSDLSLRPVFHQKTERVEAHLLVCFLGLALWRPLEMWMRGKGLGHCARQLRKEVATTASTSCSPCAPTRPPPSLTRSVCASSLVPTAPWPSSSIASASTSPPHPKWCKM